MLALSRNQPTARLVQSPYFGPGTTKSNPVPTSSICNAGHSMQSAGTPRATMRMIFQATSMAPLYNHAVLTTVLFERSSAPAIRIVSAAGGGVAGV